MEHELGGEQADMSLILSDDVLPLHVHVADIVFVAVVEVVHLPD